LIAGPGERSVEVAPASLFRSRFARGVIRFMAGIANPAVSRVAGSRWFPPFGVLVHRGRRSGRAYATPVGMGWTGSAFVIPLTFGDRSHWYRNVIEAGEFTIVWKGARRRAGSPAVIGAAEARPSFPRPLWWLLSLVGIRTYLKVEPIG
jgi:deazaflavin-dependent oxidoreductase (nitroreductase family)